jgi:hypothetical protein
VNFTVYLNTVDASFMLLSARYSPSLYVQFQWSYDPQFSIKICCSLKETLDEGFTVKAVLLSFEDVTCSALKNKVK